LLLLNLGKCCEPHPDNRDKCRIVDGDRRWTNSKVLVEVQKKEKYRRLPAEITDRTLVGRASAANILGTTVRDLDKLVEIYDLSEKLTNLLARTGIVDYMRTGNKEFEQEASHANDLRHDRQKGE
jgi:ParB family transcriptional regulator, chromosome partitioning protein